MATVDVDKNAEKLDFPCIAGGSINSMATLKSIWQSLQN